MAKSHGISTGRRQFLKVVVAVAGGAWAPLGCGSSDSKEDGRQSAFFPQSVASGDPRPGSVVLWTRVLDPARAGEDLEISLEVAKDAQFHELVTVNGAGSLRIVAAAGADGCVKVRLTELEPGTTYYYRFVYADIASRVGRTRTAPNDSSDADVRFAVVSCQDYRGKYYHVLRRLLSEEPEFVVHLGDYVYESGNTTREGPRDVVFSKPEEALEVGETG
ncbi:MAG TPA: PhoD-like phosphatase N-terminal domain-containing protein, partial [Polyangiales bacterium]|nr:PhoD-like phosphatase N-terminal domain-containing protein [Polyangiales bacterium]